MWTWYCFLLSQQHDDGQRRETEVRLTTMHSKEGERVAFTFQTRLKRAVVLTSLEGLDLTPLVSPMVSILKKKNQFDDNQVLSQVLGIQCDTTE